MESLKKKILDIIDENTGDILEIADLLYENPELGYKEYYATELVGRVLDSLGYHTETGVAYTGCIGRSEKKKGPTLAILGELDSVICHEHENSDSETGAVHACGHHIQVAVMLGVARVFSKSDLLDLLEGNLVFMGVPSEEFIDLEYRRKLKRENKITFMGGKQELISKGYFDDVDLSMMMHIGSIPKEYGVRACIGLEGNGFQGKMIKYIGKSAHAGANPENGVNALNAAMLGLNAIHANRETFKDEDNIRVHPIITKGGDIVNTVPNEVTLEAYVRGRTIDSIKDANRKVNNALKSGALAIGADVVIEEIPGYLPLKTCHGLDKVLIDNLNELFDEKEILEGGEFSASTDFGDVTHIMPGIHAIFRGSSGLPHTDEFHIIDLKESVIDPVKSFCLTIIDLLANDAEKAKKIIDDYDAPMEREAYKKYLNELDETIFYKSYQ